MIKTQSGRSMVEMLGVLAIIGVLSVGSIAGYSKAMMKYKLNKQAEQMNQIMAAISRHTGSFRNIQYESFVTDAFTKMGEFPSEMPQNYSTTNVYDIFKNRISVVYSPKTSSSNHSAQNEIRLDYYLSTDSNTSVELCRSLFVAAKEQSGELHRIYTMASSSPNGQNQYYGDKYCTNNCIKNLSMNTIGNICANAGEKKSGSIRDTDMVEEMSLSTFGLSIGGSSNNNDIENIHFVWKAD